MQYPLSEKGVRVSIPDLSLDLSYHPSPIGKILNNIAKSGIRDFQLARLGRSKPNTMRLAKDQGITILIDQKGIDQIVRGGLDVDGDTRSTSVFPVLVMVIPVSPLHLGGLWLSGILVIWQHT